MVRVRSTISGAIAGLAGGGGLVVYEAAVALPLPGLAGSLIFHAVICGAIGGRAGFFLGSAREDKE
jgi:hypothetical protein